MKQFWAVMKWVLGIGIVVVLVCGGSGVFLWPKIQKVIEEQRKAAAGKAVQVAKASKGELTRVVAAPGTIKAKSEVEISARVAAKIEKLPFKEGEKVKAGDIVVELDANDLKAALDGARAGLLANLAALKTAEASAASDEAALIGTKASLDNAKLEWERQQELFNSGDVSQADLDRAKAELDRAQSTFEARRASLRGVQAGVEAAQAQVKIAESQVKRAEDNLNYTVIKSPIDGSITQLNVEVGELAVTGTMNNPGTVLMKIADLSEMIVEARVAEVDVNRVEEGQRAKVFINGFPDITFNGTLRRVGLESRTQAGDATTFFKAEVVLDLDGQAMFAGLSANVDIETENVDGIIVPSQAVLDKRIEDLPKEIREGNSLVDQDKTFVRVVFVKDGDKAVLRPVKVGGGNLQKSAITDGLPEGMEVIVGPFRVLQELSHNTGVRLMDDEKKKDEKPGDKAVAAKEAKPADGGAAKSDDSKKDGATTADASGTAGAEKKDEKPATVGEKKPDSTASQSGGAPQSSSGGTTTAAKGASGTR